MAHFLKKRLLLPYLIDLPIMRRLSPVESVEVGSRSGPVWSPGPGSIRSTLRNRWTSTEVAGVTRCCIKISPIFLNVAQIIVTKVFIKWSIVKNGPTRPLFHLFSSFQTHITILQQIKVKNVHPVYGAGIRTHDLWNTSLIQ